ncbi:MAG: SDR family oxidoreductase [Polyangiaceae bacterium]|nr:SDR family oxidoreductase [Polyangiaceae bacterium]
MPHVAIVSGAAGALGSEVARTLSHKGCALVLVDVAHHAEGLERLAASLVNATWAAGDAAGPDVWAHAIESAERAFGEGPSQAALIAGTWRGGKPLHEQTSDATLRLLLAANVESAYGGLRALLPGMVARRRGSVIVVGSRVVERPLNGAGAAEYAATKAAVVTLAQAVAAEVLPHGVRVNAVLPSTLDTPANRAAMPNADASRWVSLASAAHVIAFLLSDEAHDVSGAAVPIYGRA